MHIAPIAGLAEAISLAAVAHNGQVDKAGVPYIAHPLRMVVAALEDGLHHEVAIVAALHDIVEDTPVSLSALARLGFSERVIDAVKALTRRPRESYRTYLLRIRENAMALEVKLRDIHDNTLPARLVKLDSDQRERLIGKYAEARSIISTSTGA